MTNILHFRFIFLIPTIGIKVIPLLGTNDLTKPMVQMYKKREIHKAPPKINNFKFLLLIKQQNIIFVFLNYQI